VTLIFCPEFLGEHRYTQFAVKLIPCWEGSQVLAGSRPSDTRDHPRYLLDAHFGQIISPLLAAIMSKASWLVTDRSRRSREKSSSSFCSLPQQEARVAYVCFSDTSPPRITVCTLWTWRQASLSDHRRFLNNDSVKNIYLISWNRNAHRETEREKMINASKDHARSSSLWQILDLLTIRSLILLIDQELFYHHKEDFLLSLPFKLDSFTNASRSNTCLVSRCRIIPKLQYFPGETISKTGIYASPTCWDNKNEK